MRKKVIFLVVIALVLIYCGFLSGSKSFVLVAAMILLLWIVAVWKIRGRPGLKIVLMVCFVAAAIYIATSAMFGELIKVVTARFSRTTDLNSFTTGRIGLWESYMGEMLENPKVLFLGEGFTNIKVNERSSHNTIIQIFFQFGIVGAPIVFYWIVNLFRGYTRKKDEFRLHRLMVLVGAFVPWLAIDLLFFDEFFLFPWYMMAALAQFNSQSPIQRTEEEQRIDST